MLLTNSIPVKATPEEVFALVNDVERVASCMPGAALDGRDGDTWHGRVKVKVGPISAAYSGNVRFLEVDPEQHRLRVQARGADTHGSGEAEAEVSLEVTAAPEGALLRLTTDLVIRGKIAQFGKGAIVTVSDRILQQFAQNLGSLLDQDRTLGSPDRAPAAASPQPAAVTTATPPAAELDGLSLFVGPALSKYGPVVGAFACGLFQGWLLGRMMTQEKQLRAIRRPA